MGRVCPSAKPYFKMLMASVLGAGALFFGLRILSSHPERDLEASGWMGYYSEGRYNDANGLFSDTKVTQEISDAAESYLDLKLEESFGKILVFSERLEKRQQVLDTLFKAYSPSLRQFTNRKTIFRDILILNLARDDWSALGKMSPRNRRLIESLKTDLNSPAVENMP